jgi:hypothetical protein
MQDQRLLATFINPLSEASPAHQIPCDGWILTLPDIPGHHLVALHVDHQIEVEPHTSHSGGQVGDVPAPHLIRPSCSQAWVRSGLLWWPSSPPMGFPCAWSTRSKLRSEPIYRPRSARSGPAAVRQCGEFRFVAGQQPPCGPPPQRGCTTSRHCWRWRDGSQRPTYRHTLNQPWVVAWLPIIALPLAALGLADDRVNLPAALRYFFQALTAVILVLISPLPLPIAWLHGRNFSSRHCSLLVVVPCCHFPL